MGLLISLGQFQGLSQFFGQLGFRIERWERTNPQFAQLLSTIILAILAGTVLIPSIRSIWRNGWKPGSIFALGIALSLFILGILNQINQLSVIGFIIDWFNFQGI
jgi:hypothetical protein